MDDEVSKVQARAYSTEVEAEDEPTRVDVISDTTMNSEMLKEVIMICNQALKMTTTQKKLSEMIKKAL